MNRTERDQLMGLATPTPEVLVPFLERMRSNETTLARAAELLRSTPEKVPEAIERLLQKLHAAKVNP